ncbi:MAG: hypothetical protein A2Z21_08720 [Candidatus Fraserbacteria bacterium RBG_16_55_9]|uniref:ABC transporter domain-containing protein n=1 Tax=Fraserbacteria sp. (strain RBG_16_55_9) TaxID=1817864 RepID=A0A1F5V0C4_FRAXR|nr:MAG: hypothetical protein A2Z21_08720 [Candidatus Fraserbacteria bacterium RBG_16_55_9]
MPIIIQISELGAWDPEGQKVFSDLHFRLHRGEWACITGPPGSGKTLLLSFIYGEQRPKRGQILVDDRNVMRIHPEKLRQLRRRMGVVSGGMAPLERRTLEGYMNFKLRALDLLHEEARIKALDVLELVGLGNQVGCHTHEISEADQQLFRLGLAISHDPVLLLIDDPLQGLPPAGVERFVTVLEQVQMRRRMSILMTTREAPWADRFHVNVYVLEGGSLRALHPAAITDSDSGIETS